MMVVIWVYCGLPWKIGRPNIRLCTQRSDNNDSSLTEWYHENIQISPGCGLAINQLMLRAHITSGVGMLRPLLVFSNISYFQRVIFSQTMCKFHMQLCKVADCKMSDTDRDVNQQVCADQPLMGTVCWMPGESVGGRIPLQSHRHCEAYLVILNHLRLLLLILTSHWWVKLASR